MFFTLIETDMIFLEFLSLKKKKTSCKQLIQSIKPYNFGIYRFEFYTLQIAQDELYI